MVSDTITQFNKATFPHLTDLPRVFLSMLLKFLGKHYSKLKLWQRQWLGMEPNMLPLDFYWLCLTFQSSQAMWVIYCVWANFSQFNAIICSLFFVMSSCFANLGKMLWVIALSFSRIEDLWTYLQQGENEVMRVWLMFHFLYIISVDKR